MVPRNRAIPRFIDVELIQHHVDLHALNFLMSQVLFMQHGLDSNMVNMLDIEKIRRRTLLRMNKLQRRQWVQ